MQLTSTTDAASLGEAFQRVAHRYPANVAVDDGRERLTYAELDSRSAALAGKISAHGAGPGQLVGVLVDRSAQAMIAILGVLRAGAAYVPLDPAYPADRLQYMVSDSGVDLLVGDPKVAADCGLTGIQVISPRAGAGAEVRPVPLPNPVQRDDSAYVIYTSGSTGQPKGCVVSHGNALSLLESSLPLFEFGPLDRWSVFHSFCFDFSVWEMWGALATGATAVCVPQERARSTEDFLDFVRDERITVLNQVPSAFRALAVLHGDDAGRPLSLRYVIFGGESIDLDVVRDFSWSGPGPAPVMVNMYGITEITVHATIKFLTDEDYQGSCTSPIGEALPHLSIEVRDDNLALVPPGTAGEMWVSGAGVATGYLNRPELTAERFVSFDSEDGPRRAYRTGDLARTLPDGQLEYLGRNDQQVKIRGFRIELNEIESALRSHPLVSDVAVTAVLRESTGQMLLACVVPTQPDIALKPLTVTLRGHLLGLLPRHMVPDRFRVIAELPFTPSGKLDRRALALLDTTS